MDLDQKVVQHIQRWADEKARAKWLATASDPSSRPEGSTEPQPDLWGWAVTATFYAALHLTQAYLSTKGERFKVSDHGERAKAIKAAKELRQNFREAYEGLKKLSETARYDETAVIDSSKMPLAQGHLTTVESFLISKLRHRGYTVPP